MEDRQVAIHSVWSAQRTPPPPRLSHLRRTRISTVQAIFSSAVSAANCQCTHQTWQRHSKQGCRVRLYSLTVHDVCTQYRASCTPAPTRWRYGCMCVVYDVEGLPGVWRWGRSNGDHLSQTSVDTWNPGAGVKVNSNIPGHTCLTHWLPVQGRLTDYMSGRIYPVGYGSGSGWLKVWLAQGLAGSGSVWV